MTTDAGKTDWKDRAAGMPLFAGEIWLVRHGETGKNRMHTLQGSMDEPLSEIGRRQAREAAAEFRERGIFFDRVISSPLDRAIETAEIITGADRSGFEIDDRIREISFGRFEGVPLAEALREEPDIIGDPARYFPTGGGESIYHLVDRAGGFVTELGRRDLPGRTLVSGHGALIRAILTAIGECTGPGFWRQVVGNCAWFCLRMGENGHFTVADRDEKHSQARTGTQRGIMPV